MDGEGGGWMERGGWRGGRMEMGEDGDGEGGGWMERGEDGWRGGRMDGEGAITARFFLGDGKEGSEGNLMFERNDGVVMLARHDMTRGEGEARGVRRGPEREEAMADTQGTECPFECKVCATTYK